MKKLVAKGLFPVIAAIATLIATTVASSACLMYFYQPEEPKSLQD